MTSDTEEPGTSIVYGYRLDRVPPGVDLLDEEAEPRLLHCGCCGQLSWFAAGVIRDLIRRNGNNRRWKLVGICIDCAIEQVGDPAVPESLRALHMEVLGPGLARLCGQTSEASDGPV
jgi:hypothetical protein